MIIFSVDYGKVRTGLAVCDKNEIIASPVGVITEYNMEKLAVKVANSAIEHKAELIVVGLPLNMNGSEGESAENARMFSEMLKEQSGLEVELWDERCTTVTAYKFLNMTDTRGKKRKAVVDSVAATIILENYLDFRRNNK